MIDAETLDTLERIAVALERLANHFAPQQQKREPRPATLSTASYTREEREWKDWKAGRSQEQAGSPSGTSRPKS